MPDTTGRLHLYSDTNKFATGSALYQIQNGNHNQLHMPVRDFQRPQRITQSQN